jgi:hypothetical protein
MARTETATGQVVRTVKPSSVERLPWSRLDPGWSSRSGMAWILDGLEDVATPLPLIRALES